MLAIRRRIAIACAPPVFIRHPRALREPFCAPKWYLFLYANQLAINRDPPMGQFFFFGGGGVDWRRDPEVVRARISPRAGCLVRAPRGRDSDFYRIRRICDR